MNNQILQERIKQLEKEMIDAMLKGENFAPGAYQQYCSYQEQLRKNKLHQLSHRVGDCGC